MNSADAPQETRIPPTFDTPHDKRPTSGPAVPASHVLDNSSSAGPSSDAPEPQASQSFARNQPITLGSNPKVNEEPSYEMSLWRATEYNDIQAKIFGCEFLTGTYKWKRELVIENVYLAILNSSATNEQLSRYFKTAHHLEITGEKIQLMRSKLAFLHSGIKDNETLEAFLTDLKVGSNASAPEKERLKRYRMLLAKGYDEMTPRSVLVRSISDFNFKWADVSDTKREAYELAWEGYIDGSSNGQGCQSDQTQKLHPQIRRLLAERRPRITQPQVPRTLAERLSSITDFECSRNFLVNVCNIPAVDRLGNLIDDEDLHLVFLHAFLFKRYATHLGHMNPSELKFFFEKFYRIRLDKDAIAQVLGRLGMLRDKATKDACNSTDKELRNYLKLCCDRDRDLKKESTDMKLECWNRIQKQAETYWKEIGFIGRKVSIRQWEGKLTRGRSITEPFLMMQKEQAKGKMPERS